MFLRDSVNQDNMDKIYKAYAPHSCKMINACTASVRGALNEATAWEIFVRNFEDNIKLDRHERTANLENGLNFPTTGYNGHIL